MGTQQFELADHVGQTLIMDIIGKVDDHRTKSIAMSRIVVVETDEEYDDVRLRAADFPPRAELDGMTLIGAVGRSSDRTHHPRLIGPTHQQVDAALALSAQLYRRDKRAPH